MRPFFDALWENPAYTIFAAFLCAHPLGSGLLSAVGSLGFRSRPDATRWYVAEPDGLDRARSRYPVISVVIPAHNEETVIAGALDAVLGISWPELDVIVVDDGSTDETRRLVLPYVESGRVRLLRKSTNEGKSMAINDALPLCRGELVLLMDADGLPDAAVLEQMVPHFVDATTVALVTGNPRVLNTRTFLARLQAIEFSATVGVQRRGDAVWGRLMTFSGLCALFDRSAIVGLGGFAPDMVTEDIDMTWRLQLAGREVVYEPAALFGMQAPESLGALWRQRHRWVVGLAQVLRRHTLRALKPANWRMWPLLLTGGLSIVWAHALVGATLVWTLSEPLGVPPPEIAPFLALFGAVTILAGILQAVVGIRLDHRHDPGLVRQFPWAPWFPLCYWVLCVLLVVRGTLPGLWRRPKLAVWNVPREEYEAARAGR
ncbi:MAG TPA: glycosyltransferase family 2 protein [Gaiellaceae bacterium]